VQSSASPSTKLTGPACWPKLTVRLLSGRRLLHERDVTDIALVGAVGGCGEAEQEGGVESIEQAAVGGGVGVVDFVDDHVVEPLGDDAGQVLGAGELLERAHHDVGLGLHQITRAPAHLCGLACGHEQAAKGVGRLSEELLSGARGRARGHFPALRAKRAMSKAASQVLPRPVASTTRRVGGPAGVPARARGAPPPGTRGVREEGRGARRRHRPVARSGGVANALGVGVDPQLGQVDRGRPERLDGGVDAVVGDGVDGSLDAKVPLDAGLERGAGELLLPTKATPELGDPNSQHFG
jgi:hypothetical protein